MDARPFPRRAQGPQPAFPLLRRPDPLRSAERWAGALNDDTGGGRLEEGWDDYEVILRELDRLHGEVLERRSESHAATPVREESELAPRPSELRVDRSAERSVGTVPDTRAWPGPTPYLEERLRVANAAVSSLGREVRDLDERWRWLMQTTASLEAEITRANRELEFMRSVGWLESAPKAGRGGALPAVASTAAPRSLPRPTARSPPPPPRLPRPSSHGPVGSPPERFEPYRKFTSARYNQTVGELKARRRRLGSWTLVAAGAISAVLVTLTAIANQPMPTLWLAVLPVIWMIPVPFFLLSFRGTHRVLRRNHLEVALDP